MTQLDTFDGDVADIAAIEAVPTILEVAARTTGMGLVAVARVTDERWVACDLRDEIGFGLKPGDELQIDTTICRQVCDTCEPVVIDEVATDPLFHDHPTPKLYGFQSYISVPIRRADGSIFGTLCAIDPRPARLDTPTVRGMFGLFADLIGFHLDARERLASSERALLNERQTAELREQFIAVLGHDLRNPLASVEAGIKRMRTAPLDERHKHILSLMEASIGRMSGLVANLMDFARGRLGGGLKLDLAPDADLRPALELVVGEIEAAWPDRRIEIETALHAPICCDRARIAQLFSNLLANALAHGRADRPVRVRAASDASMFELSVANAGEPIPPPMIDRLFQPFFRASVRASQQGLGLGLYIASEIAKAHGGTLDVFSTPSETRFTFRMPAAGPQSDRTAA